MAVHFAPAWLIIGHSLLIIGDPSPCRIRIGPENDQFPTRNFQSPSPSSAPPLDHWTFLVDHWIFSSPRCVRIRPENDQFPTRNFQSPSQSSAPPLDHWTFLVDHWKFSSPHRPGSLFIGDSLLPPYLPPLAPVPWSQSHTSAQSHPPRQSRSWRHPQSCRLW